MHSIARQGKQYKNIRNRPTAGDPKKMLEDLFSLDRMLIEVSMQLYNVNGRERSRMRRQNRRLHAALRRHIPQLMTRYPNPR